jgi:hypothetical protein
VGLGDVLLSIGEAKRVHQRTGQPVLITDPRGMPVRSDLFAGVPYLLQRPERIRYQRLVNSPGHRPYIKLKTAERWYWNKYRPEPADVVLTEAEYGGLRIDADTIIVEPNVKDIGHRNKDWGWKNWQALADLLKGYPVVQMTRPGDPTLKGVDVLRVESFRRALACLDGARLYVGPEGGLHHGAAAVGTPAVVLFGGFISPETTGYDQHRNLFTGGEPCGSRTDCHIRPTTGPKR